MLYTHHISPDPYPVGAVLTSRDPEPCGGHTVRDDTGCIWYRDTLYEGPANWSYMQGEGPRCWQSDHETWTKVAGNYGPVTVIKSADVDDVEGARRWLE